MAIKCLHSIHSEAEGQAKIAKPDPDEQKSDQAKAEAEQQKTYVLSFIKHDWFEKGSDLFTVHVYVRQLDKELIDVGLFENELQVKFATSHEDFLKMYPGTTANTLFNWSIKLRGSIDIANCSFKILKFMLEITLKKKKPGRWGSLEQPNLAGLTPVANGITSQELASPKSEKVDRNGIDSGASTSNNGNAQDPVNVNGNPHENGRSSPMSSEGSSSGSSKLHPDPASLIPPTAPPPPPTKPHPSDESTKRGVMGGNRPRGSELPFSEAIRSAADAGASAVKCASQEIQMQLGYTGLENLGNTCYLNSIVQCLANTSHLRDFLLSGDYKTDVNTDNPLGFGGKLAMVFANLIKNMWSGKSKYLPPQQLKSIVSDKVCQFRGFMQHDAQEFMAFLLDGLHEDLNRIITKPYTEEVEGAGKPDHEVANEAWKRHKSRNDSVIVDLFQGQLKSKLTCPVCRTISIKYDPFMNLSVPLPKEQKLLKVVVFFKDPSRMPMKIIVKVSQDAALEQLTSSVERKTGIRVQNMRVVEEFQGRFHKFFQPGNSLDQATVNDNIYVFEVLSVEDAEEEVYEVPIIQRLSYPAKIPGHCADCYRNQNPEDPLKRCMRCYAIGYCNRKCQEKNWPMHKKICKKSSRHIIGLPFIVSMPASQATFTRLKDLAEEYARHSVDVRDGEPIKETESDRDLSSSQETTGGSSSEASVETHPRFHFKPVTPHGESITGPVSTRLTDQGDQPLDLTGKMLALDWRNIPRQMDYVVVTNKTLECAEDPCCDSEDLTTSYSCTLQECIELFTEPETLGEDDAWHCPKCKAHRQATKQMSVWRLPDVLIIHLKRFSFKNISYKDKISKLVKFPLRGLDMSPYSLDKGRTGKDVYDLYAVANHIGAVNFGHYTAFARLPPTDTASTAIEELDDDIKWRYCDDRSVTVTTEDRVVSKYAYVLFYQRRGTSVTSSTQDPPSTVTNGTTGDHAPVTMTTLEEKNVTREAEQQEAHSNELTQEYRVTPDDERPTQSAKRDVSATAEAPVSQPPVSRNLADVDECELD